MKKPDRFSRVVEKADIKDSDVRPLQWVERILRDEHRAVVKLIKQNMRRPGYTNICNEAVRLATYEHLLAALARRVR